MAGVQLPRRSGKIQEKTIQRNRSSLEILMQMGFLKHRAEKSLAATGDKGVQLASDWLLSHVSDPVLDEHAPRDYILYLCPVGQMQQELLDFWQKSYQECGWNRAHNYFPHITLCSFFKAEDCNVSLMSHKLKTCAEDKLSAMPKELPLEYFSSTNFIGLFVQEMVAVVIKQLTNDFAEEVKKLGVTVEPHKKQLHMSLAYQFRPDKKEKLELLAKTVKTNIPVRWDIRLYSRDARIANCQVRKVLYPATPTNEDELDLIDGDFVSLPDSDWEGSSDGWHQGTSWLTGVAGMFPGSYTERTAESETWTMHRSVPVIGTDLVQQVEQNGPSQAIDNSLYTQLQLTRTMRRQSGASSPKASRRAPRLVGVPSGLPPGQLASGGTQPQSVGATAPGGPSSAGSPTMEKRPIHEPPKPSSASTKSEQSNKRSQVNPSQSPSRSAHHQQQPQLQLQQTQQQQQQLQQQQLQQQQLQQQQLQQQPQASNHQATNAQPHSHSQANCAERTSPSHRPADGKHSPKAMRRTMSAATPSSNKGPRQLYVVRHGERVDFTFGKDWIQNSFDQSSNYIRYDLNMPKSLPKRKGGPQDFSKDSPLTVQGHFQAKLVGEALKEKDIPLCIVYSSPSLRCVETASDILEGLGIDGEISVEPGLFEWLGWYQNGLPRFMTPAELRDCGFNICTTHNPVWSYSKYNMQETTEQYYERCYQVTKEILKRHQAEGGNVLVVAHAASLDVCTRQLVGQPPRSHTGFHDILHKIPYGAMSVAQEACLVKDTWYLIEPPILPFAHTNNPKYNWTCLTTPSLH